MVALFLINKAKEERRPKVPKAPLDSLHSGPLTGAVRPIPILLKRPGHKIPFFFFCHSHQQVTDVLLATEAAQPIEEPNLATGLGPRMLRPWVARLQLPVGKQPLVASPGNLTENSTWLSVKEFLN